MPSSWPPQVTLAMGVLRETMRQVPVWAIRHPEFVRLWVQPVACSVGFPQPVLPSSIELRRGTANGIKGEWLLPSGIKPGPWDRMLLWAHGGGFAFASPRTHRLFLAQIAITARIPIFCPDYRKPPHHPFPAPVQDICSVYLALQGKVADNVFIGGDSAGGNLALAATQKLIQAGVPMPAGVPVLSPWTDPGDITSLSWKEYAGIDFIPSAQALAVAKLYAGGLDLSDPRIALTRSIAWDPFPPILLQYGACEVFRTQMETLASVCTKHGVKVETQIADEMPHVFPMFSLLWGGRCARALEYMDALGEFLNRPMEEVEPVALGTPEPDGGKQGYC